MIRLFAALPVPFDIAEPLERRQQGLPGARWTPLENLHITLRFFGEVSETVAADLDAELARIIMGSFEVALEGAGVGAGQVEDAAAGAQVRGGDGHGSPQLSG